MKNKEVIIDKRPGKDNKVIALARIYIYYKDEKKKPLVLELEKDLGLMQVTFDYNQAIEAYVHNGSEKGMVIFQLTTSGYINNMEEISEIVMDVSEVDRRTHKPVNGGLSGFDSYYWADEGGWQ